MKIIDKENMKRVRKEDPVKKNAEKAEEAKEKEFSPMDPPEPEEAPGKIEEVPYEKMPTLIQRFMDEHQNALKEIAAFEDALQGFKEERWVVDKERGEAFQRFFQFLDETILDHNQREEKDLFPLVHQRLIESGEHGRMSDQEGDHRTAIDIMEDDHVKFVQYSALVFNFIGLAEQLPDPISQSMVADLAYNKGMELTELLRLHIEREDSILFPQAYRLITAEEFEEMEAKAQAEESRSKPEE